MSVEVTPLGHTCNIGCLYCYQVAVRDAGNAGGTYDLEAIKRALKGINEAFTIFGGEPLLVPIKDLRELFKFGLDSYNERQKKSPQKHGPNGVQTNGTLITEEHLTLFRDYKVHVGFSMDGPGELNDGRWAGTLEKTRELTAKSQKGMEMLLGWGVGVSLILTLHKGNAGTPEKIASIQQWLIALQAKGLQSVRLHVLEVDNVDVGKDLCLTWKENVDLLLSMAKFETILAKNPATRGSIKFDIFTDIDKLLRPVEKGKPAPDVTCVWSPCDPLTTSAVMGVDGQGNRSNCGRTNKDGIMWVKAEQSGRERQFALYNTPQESGGCQGCRFFIQCKGQCPGTAIDGDWRNRTRDCQTWIALFEHEERAMLDKSIIPLSLAPNRADREKRYLDSLWNNQDTSSQPHGDHWDDSGAQHGDDHGDHTDAAGVGVTDEPHGDIPHGDHTDQGMA